jgi:site-specific recombinase XerD
MRNCALPSVKSDDLSIADLKRFSDGWLLASEIRPCSATTMENRRLHVRNLLWFIRRQEYQSCGVMELRAFFAYFNTGHKDDGGRWGNPQERKPVKPSTIATYHCSVTSMYNWFVREMLIEASPMARIPIPINRPDIIEPFTEQQVNALVAAAKRSRYPRRDEAMIWFLLDTGIRVTELCDLRFCDLDLTAKRASVVDGKGGKSRPVYFGKVAAKSLWSYLKDDEREPHESVFHSERGDGLTRSGVKAILQRLGKDAHIAQVRCSPHTFRHTMAISFLRNGGSQFALMQILGHTDLKMTSRYVKFAAADVEVQARQFSPSDRMKRR